MSRVNYSNQMSFNQIAKANIQRSSFKRDWEWLGNFNHGDLIPFYYDEVVPGDTFHTRANVFARATSPFIVAPMTNIVFYTYFFFVPYRLVWNNFVKFMGEQDDPDDSIDYLVPVMDTTGSLGSAGFPSYCAYDSLGIPVEVPYTMAKTPISSLPMRAINLIYNDFFRDQNTQGKLAVLKTDGPDPISSMPFRAPSISPAYDFGNYSMKINKHHDYFTSALPWPQKFTAPVIPVGGDAPVVFPTPITGRTIEQGLFGQSSNTIIGDGRITYMNADGHLRGGGGSGFGNQDAYIKTTNTSPTDAYADLADGAELVVNDIRLAFQIQRLLEANARGGTRYQEIVYSLFNVLGSDSRFQRPELLGIGRQNFNVNPVVQTSESNSTPQANISAFGTTIGNKHGFAKSFNEHGMVIGFISSKADLIYQQGVERKWTRQTRYDFYFPQFAHLGEQGIYNREIYFQGTAGASGDTDNAVFGYQERWSEMRYKNSLVTNQMRSSDPTSLDVWHMAQDFTALPELGYAFSQEDQPFKRLVAVQSAPDFSVQIFCNEVHARPLPVRSIPGYVDHF